MMKDLGRKWIHFFSISKHLEIIQGKTGSKISKYSDNRKIAVIILKLEYYHFTIWYEGTVMILSFRTDRPGQTVQTQIRLLLEEQSDQGLHCLPFGLHRLDP